MALPRRTIAGLGFTLFASATACSLVLGLRDGTIGGDAGADAGADAGDAGLDVDPNPAKDVVTVDVDNASCGDASRSYDSNAIHVDPALGADTSTCMAPTEPCKSLTHALKRVDVTHKLIYLAEGTYLEDPIVLTPGLAGVTIEGGWRKPGWTSECSSSLAKVEDRRGKDAPGGSPTIHINDTTGVTLRLFTVTSRNQGYVGTGVTAVAVTGTQGAVTFDNMTLVARLGGDGTIGASGGTGVNPCGVSGNGASGGVGAAGDGGIWGVAGFSASTGGEGSAGNPGTPGGPGGAGAQGLCYAGCMGPPCMGTVGSTVTAQSGTNGCSGAAGSGGLGGGGGGPTTALFVWGSKVSLIGGTSLVTIEGGRGGAGGAGGPGGSGMRGMDAPPTTCLSGCVPTDGGFPDSGGSCLSMFSSLDGGVGGDAGGPGGTGGSGGGGRGGSSYLIAQGSGAVVGVDAGVLGNSDLGDAGQGGAPNGTPGEKTPVKALP